jgi:hypothetical protein
VHAHQHLVICDDGPLDLSELENVGRRSVRVVDERLHRVPPPTTVRTTLPVFCPVSTYLVASTTCSSG